jgi:hypothetical protein
MLWEHNSCYGSQNFISLATRSERLLRWQPDEWMVSAQENPNISPVQSEYGVAWACYINLTRTEHMVSFVNKIAFTVANIAHHLLDTMQGLPNKPSQYSSSILRSTLDNFGRIVAPFHDAIADELSMECASRLNELNYWLERLDSGASTLEEIELKTLRLLSDLADASVNNGIFGLASAPNSASDSDVGFKPPPPEAS